MFLLILPFQMDETMEVDSGMKFQNLMRESEEFEDAQGTYMSMCIAQG